MSGFGGVFEFAVVILGIIACFFVLAKVME